MYWLTGILGVALIAAPWIFGYATNLPAMMASDFVGGFAIVFSIIEAIQSDKKQWEYWAIGVLGIIAIAAPFILGFGNAVTPMWTTIIGGVLLLIVSASRLMTDNLA